MQKRRSISFDIPGVNKVQYTSNHYYLAKNHRKSLGDEQTRNSVGFEQQAYPVGAVLDDGENGSLGE